MIAKHLPVRYFDQEFFNPLRNPTYFHQLVTSFGCELACCAGNIADVPNCLELNRVYDATWAKEGYGFTKEVFSPTKVAWFSRHFRCAVLLSEPGLVFPPTRLRIYSFYEHALRSLEMHGNYIIKDTQRIEHPMVWAHVVYNALAEMMETAASCNGVVILKYRDMLTLDAEGIARQLSRTGWPIDYDACAAECVATRRLPKGREHVLTSETTQNGEDGSATQTG